MNTKTLRMIIASASASVSSLSWGLGAINCSDAGASLQRTEDEIWGANIIRWSLAGQEVPEDKVAFDYDGRTVLAERQDVVDGLATKFETFAAKVNIADTAQRIVICEAWSNNALD